MQPRYKALLVHLLTATGAVLSMLAMLAAVNAEWSMMFLWLVAAFAVDGVDGPLARRYDVRVNWPTYDGVLMDLIIDYLTYVFIPAFALFKSGLLSGWTGWFAIIVITYGSVIYFADTRMKTRDYSFAGFPGCWNMVVLVLFAVKPHWTVILAIIVVLTVAMFSNIKFIHPVRTERWRYIRYRTGEEELYDHQTDPNEWNNLANDPKLAELRKQMAKWLPTKNSKPNSKPKSK